jgi:dihydrofolate reductase
MITLIAAIGKNNELGYKNQLLCYIPEDLAYFKSYTMGKTIIMGRKTFQSIGRELPGRKSIVVSANGLDNTVSTIKNLDLISSNNLDDLEYVIIGGESIYRQTIDRADKLMITHIESTFIADTFFPEIDNAQWKINKLTNGRNSEFSYTFTEYIRQ